MWPSLWLLRPVASEYSTYVGCSHQNESMSAGTCSRHEPYFRMEEEGDYRLLQLVCKLIVALDIQANWQCSLWLNNVWDFLLYTNVGTCYFGNDMTSIPRFYVHSLVTGRLKDEREMSEASVNPIGFQQEENRDPGVHPATHRTIRSLNYTWSLNRNVKIWYSILFRFLYLPHHHSSLVPSDMTNIGHMWFWCLEWVKASLCHVVCLLLCLTQESMRH